MKERKFYIWDDVCCEISMIKPPEDVLNHSHKTTMLLADGWHGSQIDSPSTDHKIVKLKNGTCLLRGKFGHGNEFVLAWHQRYAKLAKQALETYDIAQAAGLPKKPVTAAMLEEQGYDPSDYNIDDCDVELAKELATADWQPIWRKGVKQA